MRRRPAIALAGGVVVLLGGGAVIGLPYVLAGGDGARADAAETLALRAVKVERTSLAQGMILSGTLSRGAALPLDASAGGVLTWLPAAGQTVAPGMRLFESNGRPVFLLQGSVPLWRPLQLGDRGKDVLSLNQSLAGAGLLDPALADDLFGPGTSAAIGALYRTAGYSPPSQTDEGLAAISEAESAHAAASTALAAARTALTEAGAPPSALTIAQADAVVVEARTALESAEASGAGVALARAQYEQAAAERAALAAEPNLAVQQAAVHAAEGAVTEAAHAVEVARTEHVSPQEVVILDVAEVRVDSVPARVGDQASGTVLQWTAAMVRAEAQVPRSQQASLSAGDTVTVMLPTGTETTGRIVEPNAPPVENGTAEGSGEGSDASGQSLATVVIELDDQDAVSDLTGAAVRITVTSASVADALVVPVTALVALAEGGYAVEKVVPGGPPGRGELTAVEVGLVAEAKAQVTSAHLREGDEVLVP